MSRFYGDIKKNQAILEMPKLFSDDLIMETDTTTGNESRFNGAMLINAESMDNIPGLSLRFTACRTPEYNLCRFGLFLRDGADLCTLLDICVYPTSRRSHADRKKRISIYGSHYHILNETHVLDMDYDTNNWLDYLVRFKEMANISFTSSVIVPPFAGELL